MNDAVREERLRRWRLVLGRPGGSSSVSTGATGRGGSTGAAGPAADRPRSVSGALAAAARTRRPRLADVDWPATIRANLKHYQPDLRTIIAETLIGHARRRRIAALKDVILVVDQSGSMTTSVVYAGVMAASLASLRAVHTPLIVFDTSVVDPTGQLAGPADRPIWTPLSR